MTADTLDTTQDPGTATATATAIDSPPETETQRVGVHPDAGARAPSRVRARVRARKAGTAAAAGLRRSGSHGPPWEETPPSLTALRLSIHERAKPHAVLPWGDKLYLAWGYAFVLPVSAVFYTVLWLLQAPPRTATAVVVLVVLHHFHALHSLPVIGGLPPLTYL